MKNKLWHVYIEKFSSYETGALITTLNLKRLPSREQHDRKSYVDHENLTL